MVVFNYTGSPDVEVSWQIGDTVTLTGDSVSYVFNSSGTYPVGLIAENHCGADTVFFSVILTLTSLADLDYSSGAKIYPNPAKDEIYISTSPGQTILNVLLMTADGKQVKVAAIVKNEIEWLLKLDNPTLLSGFYILIVKTERGDYPFKLILNKA